MPRAVFRFKGWGRHAVLLVWAFGVAAAALIAIAVISRLAVPLAAYVARIPAVRDILGVFESLMAFRGGKPLFEQTWTSAIVHVNGIVSYALAGKALADLRYPLLETQDEWVLHGFSFANYLAELGPNRIALTRDALLRVDVLLPRFFLPEHTGIRYT